MIDIGTGDGRFVSAAAAACPAKFFIGVDANVKPLEKPSMKATRKPLKGGLPNAMFVQAAVEDLPAELDGVADEIHIQFPWGSLLKAVATGDVDILAALNRITAPGCLLTVVFGIDEARDRTEIVRLGLPDLSLEYLSDELLPKYQKAGFTAIDSGFLNGDDLRKLETSWARKLSLSSGRKFAYLILQAA